MKKRLLTLMAIVMALGMIFAAGSAWAADDSDAVTFTITNDQTLTIDDASQVGTASIATFTGNAVVTTAWTVNSNNGFLVSFDGSSQDDDGSSTTTPQFSKQDVGADGTGTGSYDHLDTYFAVEITNEDSVAGTDGIWGTSITSPDGTPANLELNTGVAGASGSAGYFSTIMPADGTGIATVNLYAKGVAAQDTQSGDYVATVTCTVTADPK